MNGQRISVLFVALKSSIISKSVMRSDFRMKYRRRRNSSDIENDAILTDARPVCLSIQ